MLRLITGKAGTGKTSALIDEISRAVRARRGGCMMIVPEQYSHEAERELCRRCGDSLSLYAELFSFTGLARYMAGKYGGLGRACLDKGGRLLCMALALKELGPRLKVYPAAGRRAELQDSLLAAVDELKTAMIGSGELLAAAGSCGGSLGDKLEDMALVLEAYDTVVARGHADPTDRLSLLAEQIAGSELGENNRIYVDGFIDFTRQELEVLRALMKKGAQLSVCLTVDSMEGDNEIYELSRRAEGVEGLHHIAADVTKEETVRAAVAEVMAREGRIDILVNNAGFGISGAVEFTSTEDAKALFDVNFFGMVNLNRAVVPIMRAAGRGRIVNLSSVAAPVPIPFQTYYSATKAAVNAYTMALANELRPFGVTVCAVMPGDIHTGFTAARRKIGEGDDIYHGRISRSVARMEHDEQTGMDPAKAGGYIAGVALREGNRHPLYAIRFDYKFFTFLAKVLPARFLNWLIYLLYGK